MNQEITLIKHLAGWNSRDGARSQLLRWVGHVSSDRALRWQIAVWRPWAPWELFLTGCRRACRKECRACVACIAIGTNPGWEILSSIAETVIFLFAMWVIWFILTVTQPNIAIMIRVDIFLFHQAFRVACLLLKKNGAIYAYCPEKLSRTTRVGCMKSSPISS